MKKLEAKEANEIVERLTKNLLEIVPARGRPGSDARGVLGDVLANSYKWLIDDLMGPPLAKAFDVTMKAGADLGQMNWVRSELMTEKPKSLGAVLVTNSAIIMCLATCGMIIANMVFVSRSDVEAVKKMMNEAFADPEEVSADDMDSGAFRSLITLHAAITNHLITEARPLPKMIGYQFSKVYSTLLLSYRLYGDATRADEIRRENRIVHPAFCPRIGLALSR